MTHVVCAVVEVKAVLASAGRPFVREYPAETTLGVVKADILAFFGVREETVGGNQIVYTLHHGNDKLTDLNATVGSIAEKQNCKLPLLVVKDTIFG